MEENWVKVYDFCSEFAEENGGEIKGVEADAEANQTTITMEVPSVELRGGGMAKFLDILQYVSGLQSSQVAPDVLQFQIRVKGVWEVHE